VSLLPRAEDAVVEESKVRGYLLNFDHDDGKHKAEFFSRFGFSSDRWEELAEALRSHAIRNDVTKAVGSPYGVRYVVEGPMKAPDGREPDVRTVWIIDEGEELPRVVTAYPL
jgi:hypothetical protein